MAARWHTDDDVLLARLYAEGASIREISERLGRSEDAVVSRRTALGVADRRAHWSRQQDQVIRVAAEAGLPASAIARSLDVPADRLRRRRAQLVGARAPARRYSPQEDETIRQCRAAGLTPEDLAPRLDRSPDGLRLRMAALGLHDPAAARRRWTLQEDRTLREAYAAGLSCELITARTLPDRTPGAVAARAHKLGLCSFARRWSGREEAQLAAMIRAGAPVETISLALVRTPDAIRQRARRLGLAASVERQPRAGQRWTAHDDAVLRGRIRDHPSVLSLALGRSDHAVRYRMRELGLLAQRERSPHHAVPARTTLSPGELGVLARELADANGARVLAVARRLERPAGVVRREAQRLQATRARRARAA